MKINIKYHLSWLFVCIILISLTVRINSEQAREISALKSKSIALVGVWSYSEKIISNKRDDLVLITTIHLQGSSMAEISIRFRKLNPIDGSQECLELDDIDPPDIEYYSNKSKIGKFLGLNRVDFNKNIVFMPVDYGLSSDKKYIHGGLRSYDNDVNLYFVIDDENSDNLTLFHNGNILNFDFYIGDRKNIVEWR